MFTRGLVAEVRGLCERGHTVALKQLRPLGYMEVIDCLEGRTELEEAIRLTKRNSRRFAKRQMTWFRKESVDWIEPAASDEARETADKIMARLPASLRG